MTWYIPLGPIPYLSANVTFFKSESPLYNILAPGPDLHLTWGVIEYSELHYGSAFKNLPPASRTRRPPPLLRLPSSLGGHAAAS